LTPLFYQTRTIQQNAGSGRRWAQPEQEAPKTPSDHVPFEHGEDIKDVHNPSDMKTTITNTEKAAFERLFNTVIPRVVQQSVEGDNSSETADTTSKPKVALAILTPPSSIEIRPNINPTAFPAPLQKMAATAAQKLEILQEEALLRQKEDKRRAMWLEAKTKEQNKKRSDPLENKINSEQKRIHKLITKAKTDVDLWRILEGEVFSKIEALDLDGTKAAQAEVEAAKTAVAAAKIATKYKKKKIAMAAEKAAKLEKETSEAEIEEAAKLESIASEARKKKKKKTVDLAIIGPNYATFLTTAFITLRTNFPTSTLPFTILPKVKSLGRSSYALGASTQLYNELIRVVWLTYTDFRLINELLQEMVNGGSEVDEGTLNVLEAIRLEGNRIKNGRYGVNRRAVWSTDVVQNGWRKIILWIPLVRQRIELGLRRREVAMRKEPGQDEEEYTLEGGEYALEGEEYASEAGRYIPGGEESAFERQEYADEAEGYAYKEQESGVKTRQGIVAINAS